MARDGNYRKLQERNLERIEGYLSSLGSVYAKAIRPLVKMASETDFDGDGQFYFSDFPELEREVDRIVSELAEGIESTVLRGTSAEWANGESDADGTVGMVLERYGLGSKDGLTAKDVGGRVNNRERALKSFLKRDIGGGKTLSARVWDLANHQRIEVELARSIAEGAGAARIATGMKALLKEPDKLFRRVRDKNGTLRLSRNAKAYHPGVGTYLSSYRNALRLARTEFNMAYRSAEQESYRDKPYVVGIEIKRSAHPYECPVCEALAGRYPKDFKWSGWHPQCRCYMVPVLLSDDEMEIYTDTIVNGGDFDPEDSRNYVGNVPQGFRVWIESNRERAKGWSTLPYFIRDNLGYVGSFEVDTYSGSERKFTRSVKARESMRVALGEYLQSRYKGIVPNTELAAIHHYTRGDIPAFRALNKQLRAGFISDFNAAFSELLSDGLSRLRAYSGTVYRTMKLNKTTLREFVEKALGKKDVTFDGFTSASKSESVAFGTFEGKIKTKRSETVCHFEILSKCGRDISDISQFNGIFTPENQLEVLFNKGSRFKFVSVRKEDNTYYFTMEELWER